MEESIEELEARMYAQVYHDNNVEQTAETSDYLPPNFNKQSNKRYWQKSKNLSTQKDFDSHPIITHNSFNISNHQPTLPKTSVPPKVQPQAILSEDKEPSVPTAIKAFVPYKSVLSFMAAPAEVPKEDDKANNYEKKKSKSTKFPKAGKLLNPMSKQGVTKGKSAMKIEIQAKKQKATMARKKAQGRVVTTIELLDSDESDCIPVEVPPPPLITLDSSDEETIKRKRALSPSTSSIISDDFIVAGDKRRLVNPFTSELAVNKLRKVAKQKEALEKVKALAKVSSSTSSSDSARSSCERNVSKDKRVKASTPSEQKQSTGAETRSKRKIVQQPLDNSAEDSIYGLKTKAVKQLKAVSSDSSEEEAPCVNAKNLKPRRRKSTGSRKKSTDSEVDEDPKLKLIASTPIAPKNKRSRFITPSYNDDEFATMISTILRSTNVMEDESSAEDDEANKTKSDATKAVKTSETIVSIPDSTLPEKSVIDVDPSGADCEIIEQPTVVYEVPDEDPVVSDSDDSMRGFKLPIECDLSLNVTQIPYDPHEYIRNGGTSSREVSSTTSDTLVNPEIGWNDEMKFFYDGSWGDETFCISNILDAMPRDQKLWRVINPDRNRTQDSGIRVRCRKCNEVGHYATKCSKPKKRVVCFMCGEEGHRETRCPNSICLRCGKPNRLFATICTACSKLSKKYCPLCNYQGHDIDQCPDKWRRYHSTTIDSTELNSAYKVNDRVYCSICARRGHFAENCNQFLKAISGMITSSVVKITSHKSSYPRIYLNSFDQIKGVERDHQQLLALFTYLPFYRFNFKFPRNVRLYPRFIEQFMLHKKRTEAIQAAAALPAIDSPPKEKKSKKKRKSAAKKDDDGSAILQISLSSDGNRTVTSSESSATVVEHHDDSNSNYSFTEFYKPSQQSTSEEVFKSPGDVKETSFEKAIEAAKRVIEDNSQSLSSEPPHLVKNPFALKIVPLADFIPLTQDEAPQHVQILREPEVSCEARMLLTKEHFLMLTNEKGQNFLFDLQNRLCVVSEFRWDSTGNSLQITGVPSNQSMFHLEVREYLYRIQLDHHEKIMAISSQLPKNKASIVSFLKLNLQSLSKMKAFQAKKNLEMMINAERSMDHRKALKLRKTLNIAFIGHGELGDGGQHVGALRKILYKLEKELGQGKIDISTELREEIMLHMKPIFSTMNHGDYQQLFHQYSKVIKQRKKKNMLWNPMILN